MPFQNSNLKFSARPDLAANLLQILKPATINWSIQDFSPHFLMSYIAKDTVQSITTEISWIS